MGFWLIYLVLGAAAGVLAGLLGVGGGLVLVAALAWVLPYQGFAADAVMHVALATSLASIILTGLSSARAHHRRGSVGWGMVARSAEHTSELQSLMRISYAVFCLRKKKSRA